MTKNHYLQLRHSNNTLQIIYSYYLERIGIAYLTLEQFENALNKYIELIINNHLRKTNILLNGNHIFEDMFNESIKYYDEKFSIIYIVIDKKTTITEKITIII